MEILWMKYAMDLQMRTKNMESTMLKKIHVKVITIYLLLISLFIYTSGIKVYAEEIVDFQLNDIYLIENNNDHILAGAVVNNPYGIDLEYRWIVCKEGETEWTEVSPWTLNFEYLDWTPVVYGNYTIVVQVRVSGQDEDKKAYLGVEFHKYIKDKCQMPYEGEGGGYLIGFESTENPFQSYKYEMLILDCTLLAQGLPAWVYTTDKNFVAEGNAFWTIWQPQYGYYWTLFRLYDNNDNMIDEVCYGFENVINQNKPDPDLPDIYNGWIKCNDKYYYYDRTTGILQKGGTSCGITLNDDGSAVLDQYALEKIPVMLRAKEVVESITSPDDSLAVKQEKCYQYVISFPYLMKMYPISRFKDKYACPDAAYANNILNAYGNQDRPGGDCVSEAAALAYLFAELNFGQVTMHAATHGWLSVDGRFWDPNCAAINGRQYLNSATYPYSSLYDFKIN